MPTLKIVKKMSNKKLLAERKKMKSGHYVDVRFKAKKWSQYLDEEIKRRKAKGIMKTSAGKRRASDPVKGLLGSFRF